ncbi:Seven transmembrane MLO family protein [Trifolium repens]|nr:Seven transmembrane MLO family protein [Trifolium repens]
MDGEGEFENSLEYTPTWVMAGVCTVMFVLSYTVVYIFNRLKGFVVNRERPIYLALQEVAKALREESALTGLISVFLTVFGKYLTKISVPACVLHWDIMWPCSPADRLKAEAERQANAHPPAHPPTTSSFCYSKVPLLSAEAVHQIHIFVYLLAAVYFILSFISFVFGTITIRCWQKHNTNKTPNDYEGALRTKLANFERAQNNCMSRIFRIIKVLCQSFFKHFFGFVTESDYMVITWGLCMTRDENDFTDRYHNFHKDISSSYVDNFNRIVGIRLVLP